MRRARKILLWAIGLGFILPLAALWGVYLAFDPASQPDAETLSKYRELRVETPAGSVRAWHPKDNAGQPVIFVHGTPGDGLGWFQTIQEAPPGYACLTYDRPGFGGSSGSKDSVSLHAQADALLTLIRTSGVQQPILVGHSLGGPIVLEAALREPELISGLVIVGGSVDPDLEEMMWLQYVGAVWPIRHLIPSPLDQANREVLALEAQLRAMQPRLANLDVPAVILHGTQDSLVPYENVAYMRQTMPQDMTKQIIPLDGEDHFTPWDNPQAIWHAIQALSAPGAAL